MLTLLVWLVVVCFLIWAAYAIVNAFGIQDPWRTLIFVVIGAVILIGVVLPALGGGSLPPLLR